MSTQSLQEINLKSILNDEEQRVTSVNSYNNSFCNKILWCCSDDASLWCFFNSGPATIYLIDKDTDKKCCKCLDCCSWCFEIKCKHFCCFTENTICFACCCSFIFT